MPVKVKGKTLGTVEQAVINIGASATATMKAKSTTVQGMVTMTVEGATVEVNGRTVKVSGTAGGWVEITAPEVRIRTAGGVAVLNAAGVQINGAVVKLNCG
jgi:hypothetical protein